MNLANLRWKNTFIYKKCLILCVRTALSRMLEDFGKNLAFTDNFILKQQGNGLVFHAK